MVWQQSRKHMVIFLTFNANKIRPKYWYGLDLRSFNHKKKMCGFGFVVAGVVNTLANNYTHLILLCVVLFQMSKWYVYAMCGRLIPVAKSKDYTPSPLLLTHWGWDKMVANYLTTFSYTFSWMNIYKFRLRFHWSLFPRVQLTIFHHWFKSLLAMRQAIIWTNDG